MPENFLFFATVDQFYRFTQLNSYAASLPVNLDSNANYNALPRFSRVMVVSELDREDWDCLLAFEQAFPDQYGVCVISAVNWSLDRPIR